MFYVEFRAYNVLKQIKKPVALYTVAGLGSRVLNRSNFNFAAAVQLVLCFY